MVKRKGSTESAAQTDSKRAREERTKRAKEHAASRAKPAEHLHSDDDSQDFEAEKPQLKAKVRGKRAGQQACPIMEHENAPKRKPSKGRRRRGMPPTKEGLAGGASAVVSLTGQEEEEGSSWEESEDEWEEVEELLPDAAEESLSFPLPEHSLPEKPLEIEIETPLHAKERESREKREVEFESYLRRAINRFTRQLQEDIHKLFLVTLRALALSSRLIISLQPIPFKESSKPDNQRKGKANSTESLHLHPYAKPETKSGKGKPGTKQEEEGKLWVKTENVDRRSKASALVHRGRGEKVKSPEATTKSGFKEDEHPEHPRPKNERRRRVASKVSYQEPDTDPDDDSDSDFELVGGSIGSSSYSSGDEEVGPGVKRAHLRGKVLPGQGKGGTLVRGSEDCEEGDFENGPGNAAKRKRSLGSRKSSRGSGSRNTRMAGARASDQWVEVYAEAEKAWIAVDCVRNTVNCPELLTKYATKPLCYILSFDNENCVRDVTPRYDLAWMTATRKRRVDAAWWDETLSLYKGTNTERDTEEDGQLQVKLLDQPLPTSIAEFKNHPLYVLQRHLLKYETLYPPTASILGYCKKEAVYSRDCVHVLHSKDTWLKEARVVREGEVPCKMVKSQSNRARRARLANWENRDKDDLGLYGRWQTEEYHPPRACGGKVPRNDFGNVYLFRSCMLPLGCKHLCIPNLNRVARKLNIDCAAAVIGFDFHSGHSHPITDGYVVCEEHVEILQTACKQEEAEQAKREYMKREKRVLGNWKLLVKGLLIRDRLRARYSSQETTPVDVGQGTAGCRGEEGSSDTTPITDVASSWPLNRQDIKQKEKSHKLKRGLEKHLFPFEKL
ncbi:DNA repair protein complementing XP-C cells isoform X5 [Narcine bancroftii]|uniref:DNA repair protein complementing XP-C cells isoform X5 n=1 Tax=Narcine bancroftii TaxID=1343680 RepID=UPI0038321F91